jgi:shikimate dehydrogenase
MTERIRPPTSSTRVFALLGDPVAHSLSPVMQNAALESLGEDGVYVALRCREAQLNGLIRGLALAGGGGNVTLPHKERATTALDRPTEAVRRTGACNTFWLEDGDVHGDNTDVEGLRRALHRLMGGVPEGASVLLLGAGGAARAALAALLDDSVARVDLLNRTVERARAVARRLGGDRTHVLDSRLRLGERSYDLVVNATRLGLGEGDPVPLELGTEAEAGAVLDLVYGVGETPLVTRARELGIPAMDGGEMLLQQGAVAFERWWQQPAPVDAMRGVLDRIRDRVAP